MKRPVQPLTGNVLVEKEIFKPEKVKDLNMCFGEFLDSYLSVSTTRLKPVRNNYDVILSDLRSTLCDEMFLTDLYEDDQEAIQLHKRYMNQLSLAEINEIYYDKNAIYLPYCFYIKEKFLQDYFNEELRKAKEELKKEIKPSVHYERVGRRSSFLKKIDAIKEEYIAVMRKGVKKGYPSIDMFNEMINQK